MTLDDVQFEIECMSHMHLKVQSHFSKFTLKAVKHIIKTILHLIII